MKALNQLHSTHVTKPGKDAYRIFRYYLYDYILLNLTRELLIHIFIVLSSFQGASLKVRH